MSKSNTPAETAEGIFTEMLRIQGEAARQIVQTFMPGTDESMPESDDLGEWSTAVLKIQQMWQEFHESQQLPDFPMPLMVEPSQFLGLMQGWQQHLPMIGPEQQQKLWQEGAQLWESILAQYGLGAGGPATNSSESDSAESGNSGGAAADLDLPRSDKRFSDPAWRKQPVFALIHQTYLLLAERITESVDELDGIDEQEREQLRFGARTVLDAMSPANFPLMNPVVLERTLETQGQNLATGMERLAADIEKGQLTHTDSNVFQLGENIAATPGKVVHETELFQLIQYSPTTKKVLEVPLIIFPPWINRFYILDLNAKKSFVKWAVDQGFTVFMVSWRSADESLAHIVMDDYVRAQIEAIDFVRKRLDVPSVHTVGYCVAGTILAATLAILDRRGEADKVAGATFLTAQVDFEHAGELKLFAEESQMEMIRKASQGGFLDGRYMAATFNLLRGKDLIWNYVVNHYLLGEDYPAFDLLHWNSDVTNLPAKWHEAYLCDLYRDNLLVQADRMEADGTPIDLRRVKVPAYVQAGREDHIAPPESVFKLLSYLQGPVRFTLAGSGHIAGVVNPPAAGKYQYWTGPSDAASLEDFISKAEEHPGSWWTDWSQWIEMLGAERVDAKGKRRPGGKNDTVIEDAPGRYVAMR